MVCPTPYRASVLKCVYLCVSVVQSSLKTFSVVLSDWDRSVSVRQHLVKSVGVRFHAGEELLKDKAGD